MVFVQAVTLYRSDSVGGTGSSPRDDLAIVIVSFRDRRWLAPCLESIRSHIGTITLDVVVVANGDDGSAELVESEFPWVRALRCSNRGFAHANNRGLETTDARYVLFLNPDTRILEGTLAELVHALDLRPAVGLAGVRHLTSDGLLFPTIRRFPSPLRALGEALGSERLPIHPAFLGERELDLSLYDDEQEIDWTTGAFMIARHEALAGTGGMDESFFLYCEEPDLCLRLKQEGWKVLHLPLMTIVHNTEKALDGPLAAQQAHSRRLYAHKHFGPLRRSMYLAALTFRYGLRAIASRRRALRAGAAAELRVHLGLRPPPFGPSEEVRDDEGAERP